jgi:hypothetical protein
MPEAMGSATREAQLDRCSDEKQGCAYLGLGTHLRLLPDRRLVLGLVIWEGLEVAVVKELGCEGGRVSETLDSSYAKTHSSGSPPES